MAKRRYSEIKHPDKFAETLSGLWQKVEPYALPVGLATAVVLVIAVGWIAISRRYTAWRERPWEERFEIASELADMTPEEAEAGSGEVLEKMSDLASKYQGRPVAAITLLEIAQAHFRFAESRLDEDPKAAREHLEKAADAAEQFIADFPEHGHVALAYYEAGKARLELGEHDRAAEHFERASESRVGYVAVLAQWHGAYCYEQLGRLDEARRIYETLRDDQMAGWCAEQAEFQLAQLGRQPSKGGAQEAAPPAPSTATAPAPSK